VHGAVTLKTAKESAKSSVY